MALSAFDDRKAAPTGRALARTLGRAGRAWASLQEELTGGNASLQPEWFFAGAKFEACAAAREAGLPAGILKLIAEAPRYAEGRGVRIPVRTAKDVRSIRTLATIKLTH